MNDPTPNASGRRHSDTSAATAARQEKRLESNPIGPLEVAQLQALRRTGVLTVTDIAAELGVRWNVAHNLISGRRSGPDSRDRYETIIAMYRSELGDDEVDHIIATASEATPPEKERRPASAQLMSEAHGIRTPKRVFELTGVPPNIYGAWVNRGVKPNELNRAGPALAILIDIPEEQAIDILEETIDYDVAPRPDGPVQER